jgi:hypothetical protein
MLHVLISRLHSHHANLHLLSSSRLIVKLIDEVLHVILSILVCRISCILLLIHKHLLWLYHICIIGIGLETVLLLSWHQREHVKVTIWDHRSLGRSWRGRDACLMVHKRIGQVVFKVKKILTLILCTCMMLGEIRTRIKKEIHC